MPAKYTDNLDDPMLGRKQRRVVTVTQALACPQIRLERDLKKWLFAQGWLHVVPGTDERSSGRLAMAKGVYFAPGYRTVAFTRHGPLLHAPDDPIPSSVRENCVEYFTEAGADSAEAYWDRVLAEQNERYGWNYNLAVLSSANGDSQVE